MRHFFGIRINKFLYLDIPLMWGGIVFVIFEVTVSDKIPGYLDTLAYRVLRVSSLLTCLISICAHPLLIWGIVKKSALHLRIYIPIRASTTVLFFTTGTWFIIGTVLPNEHTTWMHKLIKGLLIYTALILHPGHLWATRILIKDFSLQGKQIPLEVITVIDELQKKKCASDGIDGNIKKGRTSENSQQDLLDSLEEMDETEEHRKLIKSFTIPLKHVTLDPNSVLGTGQSGKVISGEYHERKVAIKMIRGDNVPGFLQSLITELKMLKSIGTEDNDEKHIVHFYGAVFVQNFCGIVLERCEVGSLHNYLVELDKKIDERPSLNEEIEKELYRFVLEIGSGMEYLASKQIVHGDVAARNVLLDGHKTAKISDFGMSLKLYNYQLYAKSTNPVFPWRWMPPESLLYLKFSTFSDVWSFGILLWEIYTLGCIPYTEHSWTSAFAQMLNDGLKLGQPELAPDFIYDVMEECWTPDWKRRPDFSVLMKTLRKNDKISA